MFYLNISQKSYANNTRRNLPVGSKLYLNSYQQIINAVVNKFFLQTLTKQAAHSKLLPFPCFLSI